MVSPPERAYITIINSRIVMYTYRSLIPGQHRHSRRNRCYANAYFSKTVSYVYLEWL